MNVARKGRLGRGWAPLWSALLLPAVFVDPPGAAAAGPGAPTHLLCEYRSAPLGIDVRVPRLSWWVTDSSRGAAQSAYQILVADDPDALAQGRGTIWDSGRVESSQSIQVECGGPALVSGKRYDWTVRTWDADGRPSPYAEPTFWEMGRLDPADWSARWITTARLPREEDPVGVGSWIWHPTNDSEHTSIYFRRTFDLPDGARAASVVIRVAADDRFVAYFNGKRVGDGTGWQAFREFVATEHATPGRNVIAVEGVNAVGRAALMVSARVRLIDGTAIDIHSGPDWRVSDAAAEGWTQSDFDDSHWQAAKVVAAHGEPPFGAPTVPVTQLRSICMRREVPLQGEVARARAYVSGLGLYRLRINGRRVGRDVFTPGWTHYGKRVQYQTYDVTPMLHKGANALAAVLGNGWWSGGLGWNTSESYAAGNSRFLLQLDVEYADGTRDRFVTDDAWKAHPSPVLENSYYHGETYDARLEMPGWDEPGFNDDDWMATSISDQPPLSFLCAQYSEPIRVTQDVPSKTVTQPTPGVYVFDFGQNLAGWVRLKVRGQRGTRVRLRFAEILNPDGTIYRDNYRSARATDVYICRGDGEEVWEPRFTYRGFRYAELTGYPGEPAPDTLLARVAHSAAPFAGEFHCSNELLNRLWENIRWGQRSNMYSVPTDCPQRDERLGWMGDAQTFAPTSCWNMRMAAFYTKWMRDILDSQHPNGAVTDVAPVTVVGGAAAPGWGDAVIVIPWTVYRFYGDTRIIEQNYDGMKAWIEYMRSQAPNDLYEREGYGDWVATVKSPSHTIGAAYYYYSTKLFAKMAAAIGRDDDARAYADLADKIAAAFNAEYFGGVTKNYLGRTQAANALPAWFGITPDRERAAVIANIADDIRKRGDHLSTGFLGTACIMPLLSRNGYHDLAYRVATQTTCPSWGYMIEHGATTIWELWDSDKQGPQMNSRNHFALGAVGQWLYEDLAGIRGDPAEPGFRHIRIQPRPAEGLASARATYASPYGTVESRWHAADGRFALDLTIPPNTRATVHVPTMGRKAPKLSESGTLIWANGAPADAAQGVTFVRADDDALVLSVGAGRYAFTLAGE
jgi:alpha-L-rhamnosidase